MTYVHCGHPAGGDRDVLASHFGSCHSGHLHIPSISYLQIRHNFAKINSEEPRLCDVYQADDGDQHISKEEIHCEVVVHGAHGGGFSTLQNKLKMMHNQRPPKDLIKANIYHMSAGYLTLTTTVLKACCQSLSLN